MTPSTLLPSSSSHIRLPQGGTGWGGGDGGECRPLRRAPSATSVVTLYFKCVASDMKSGQVRRETVRRSGYNNNP